MATRERTYWNHSLTNDYRSQISIKLADGSVVKPYDPVKGHTGIDINCVYGTVLSMPVDLKLLRKTSQEEMGTCAYFEDSEKNVLIFAHLSEVLIEKDAVAVAGTPFVKTGNSGRILSNPHLHLEIIAKKPEKGAEHMTRSLYGYSGYNIDPVPYLDKVFSSPVLTDLEWLLKHFPEIDPAWFKKKADSDPETLAFYRLFAIRMKEWFNGGTK